MSPSVEVIHFTNNQLVFPNKFIVMYLHSVDTLVVLNTKYFCKIILILVKWNKIKDTGGET